ncbi:LptF/LptG family permease [Limisphaera sp. 4302-co]|uniref:LptF/LptG family permease n=1 Tax=Limisphaera sp. 4302-co TaxID=3400417 RepID=UPI003C1CA42F
MRLLDRYLLRELAGPLAACLTGFLLVWITADLLGRMEDFQGRHLSWQQVLAYYGWRMPEFLALVLPMGLLLALLYALHRLARAHEITAMRAAGLGLWRIALPYLWVGALSSGLMWMLNESWAPAGARRAEGVLRPDREAADETLQIPNFGFMNRRDQRAWHADAFDRLSGEMTGPQVEYRTADGRRRWLFARRALYTNGVWTFFEVREFENDPNGPRHLVPVRNAASLARPDFTETPEQMYSAHLVRGRLERRISRKLDLPVRTLREYARLNPDLSPEERAWLETQLQGRFSLAATCLVVVLIALPFGVMPGRRNVFYGVAGSIFVAFAYFVLQQVGLALGTGGHLPPWLAAWSPNLIFAGLGVILINRFR